jgi:threonine dehydratase
VAETEAQPQSNAYLQNHRAELIAAAERIRPYVRRTPLLTTELDPRLRLKPECFQVTGSFKARGAFNAVLALKERDPEARGVIAVSSGNHAQALALAAQTAGLDALILIPEDANPAKVAAARAYGAEVIQQGVTFENREARLREVMAETRLTLVHPFDNWDIIHGQGTAARELLEDDGEVAMIVVPTGGGGLLSGTALAARSHGASVRVIGVEPERADDARRSLRTGSIQTLPKAPQTLADGVRVTSIGLRNFEVVVMRQLVDDIVTVSEEELEEAVVRAWLDLKLAVEPTAALPLAAYLSGKLPGTGPAPVGLVLSGGNFDPAVVARLLSGWSQSRR